MRNKFNSSFGDYVCEGDTISCIIEGFTITASIVHDDYNESPADRDEGFWPSLDPKADGYIGDGKTEEDYKKAQKASQDIMDAWLSDKWFYCGVVLKVARPISVAGRTQGEVVISDNAASLWGIECNYPNGGNDYLTTVANELLDEALSFAKEALRQAVAPYTTKVYL